MPPQTLIEPTTDVTTLVKFVNITQEMVPATLLATNLAGAEEVQVLISSDDGATSQAVQQEGTTVVLALTDSVKSINSPMMVGVTKDATLGLCGVFISYHIKT